MSKIQKFFRHKLVRFLLWVHVLLFIAFTSFFFYMKSETRATYEQALTKAPYDAIIVPGYPYKDGWHQIMRDRVYWSVYLWKKGVTKHIIYSGGAVYTPYIESVIMKQYAVKLGVPEGLIFTETRAEHSTENLYYSHQLTTKRGFNTVALATDPVQSYFLSSYADDRPFGVEFIPIQYDLIEERKNLNVNINPDVAFKDDFVALPDRENFWKRFQGTLGKNVEDKIDYKRGIGK